MNTAALPVKSLTEQLFDVVQNMSQFAGKATTDNGEQDPDEDGEALESAGPPYVELHGLSDTYNLASTIVGIAETLKEWNMLLKLRGGAPAGNPA